MNSSKPKAKTDITARRKARSLLLQALYQWQLSGTSVSEIEAQFRADNEGRIDWPFFHEALLGVVTRLTEIDGLYAPFLDRALEDLNPVELALLRMGAWELATRIDTPYRVVINEGVELAKTFGATDSHKYVNGVLDKTARKLRSVEIEARNQPPAQ